MKDTLNLRAKRQWANKPTCTARVSRLSITNDRYAVLLRMSDPENSMPMGMIDLK